MDELITNPTHNIFELCKIITDKITGLSEYTYVQPTKKIESFCKDKYLALVDLDNGVINARLFLKTISDILTTINIAYGVATITKPISPIYSVFFKIINNMALNGSIVALYGYYRMVLITRSDDPITVLKLIHARINSGQVRIHDSSAGYIYFQQLLLRIILLTDSDDIIDIAINKFGNESFNIAMLPFVHYIANNVDKSPTTITYMLNAKNYMPMDTVRRYYILIVKLAVRSGVYGTYVKISQFAHGIYLSIICDYVSGKNSHAYKIYKHLVTLPLNELSCHDKEFITIMNSLLYSPDSPGAITAATDFNSMCV